MASTALSVSVTRSTAKDRPCLQPENQLGNADIVQLSLVSTVEGLAEVIISPAFLATSSKVSWISCKFGLSIAKFLRDDDEE